MTDDTPITNEGNDDTTARPDSVEVRRNGWLSGGIGLLAAVLAVAFGLRALDGAVLDWIAFGVLTVIAVVHLAATVDSRAPLLVADDQGVRLRRGSEWTGIGWEEVECLEHLPRRSPWHDGHLLVVGTDQEQHLVPLTIATRIAGTDPATASDDLARLADGRSDVVEVVPGLAEDEDDDRESTVEITRRDTDRADEPDGPEEAQEAPADTETAEETSDVEHTAIHPLRAADLAREYDAASDERADEPTAERPAVPDESTDPDPGPRGAVAARETGRAGLISSLIHRRSRSAAAPTIGANALHADVHADDEAEELPEAEVLHRFDLDEVEEWSLAGVRVIEPAAPAADETGLTTVLDDLRVEPAASPVIGPQLRSSREQLRLSIDQLSERTRIRPHVIEAMESDDFGPCGGDFYARGHLRTLARVLGMEAGPLLSTYDDQYADAPVDPRRVFESELATGVGGSIRGTRGGRNWSILVAAIMGAVLIWSIATLVMDGPVPIGDAPVLNQSGGIDNGAAAQGAAVPVTLTASGGGARLVVRDGGGDVVFEGNLAFGQSTKLDIAPPVRIWSSDGSVTASLDGADAKALGKTGAEVTKTLIP